MLKVFGYGRLTADPQLFDKGCNFNVALDTAHMDPDNHRPTTEFFRCTVWGKRGETAAKYLHKGDAITISGDMYSDEYVGRDNAKHHQMNIINADWGFGEKKRSSNVDDEDDELLPD